MEKRKYKLKGHESFVLRDGWLTKGLRAVENNPRVFSNNSGADALGVGTNMAKSIRYWMKTAGLTEELVSKGVFLTKLGLIILKEDPYLEDIFTIWLIHCNIACNYEQATLWNLFFNEINLTSAFSRDDLFKLEKEKFIQSTGEDEEKVSERSMRDDCMAILAMYTAKSSQDDDPEDKKVSLFAELGLIGRNGEKFVRQRPLLNKIDPLIILYLIINELNAKGSLQIDYITDGPNMPGKILNLNRIMVNDFMDALQNKGYIIVNRTAGLDIIYPDQCKGLTQMNLLKMHYGEAPDHEAC